MGGLLLGQSLQAQEEPETKERVDLRFLEWFVRVDGRIRDKGHGGMGSWVDTGDLGIGKTTASPTLGIDIDIPSVGRFGLGYSDIHTKGNGDLPEDTLYNDQVVLAGTAVQTEFRLKTYRFDYEYPLIRTSWGSSNIEVSPVLGIRLFSGHIDFRTASGESSSELHRPSILPGIHGSAELNSWLRGSAKVLGMAYSTTKASASYLETSVELTVWPWRGLYAGMGYQFIMNAIDSKQGSSNHNFDLDADFSGIYLVLGYHF